MDRPGVRQVPEGSGEQEKWRKLVAKSFVVSQWPVRLRDWWSWWWWKKTCGVVFDCASSLVSYRSFIFVLRQNLQHASLWDNCARMNTFIALWFSVVGFFFFKNMKFAAHTKWNLQPHTCWANFKFSWLPVTLFCEYINLIKCLLCCCTCAKLSSHPNLNRMFVL